MGDGVSMCGAPLDFFFFFLGGVVYFAAANQLPCIYLRFTMSRSLLVKTIKGEAFRIDVAEECKVREKSECKLVGHRHSHTAARGTRCKQRRFCHPTAAYFVHAI